MNRREMLLLSSTIFTILLILNYFNKFRYGYEVASIELWIPLLLLQGITIFSSFSDKYPERIRIFQIYIYAVALHLVIQFAQPPGMIYGTDALFGKVTTDLILESGRWNPSLEIFNVQFINQYILYPGQHFLFATLSLLTGISTLNLHKYMMVFINPLSVIFLYLFFKQVFGNTRLAVISALLFSTTSWFNYFHSWGLHESLAFVFFTAFLFVLFTLFKEPSGKYTLLLLIFAVSLIITHHLTSYMLLFVIAIFLISSTLWKKDLQISNIFLIVVISIFSWQIYIATFVFALHIQFLETFISVTTSAMEVSEQMYTNPARSTIEVSMIYLGGIILYVLGAYGFLLSWSREVKLSNKHLIASAFVVLFGLFFLFGFAASWYMTSLSTSASIRWRLMIFAYSFLSIYAAIGIIFVLKKFKRFSGEYTVYFLVMPIMVGGFIQATPTYLQQAELSDADDASLSWQEWVSTSSWVKNNVQKNEEILSSNSGFVYIGAFARRTIDRSSLGEISDPEDIPRDSIVILSTDVFQYRSKKWKKKLPEEFFTYLEQNGDKIYTTGKIIAFHPRNSMST